LEVRSRLSYWWLWVRSLALRCTNATVAFWEEAVFRVTLAFRVLFGLVPIETEKRPWARSVETPALLDVYDWTNDRLIFSVLVWPPLEVDISEADDVFYQRIAQVKRTIYKGAEDMLLSTRIHTTYGLRWDASRRCWVDRDHHGYDGNSARFEAMRRRP
jgi:hypothetical protein